jgi:hypothetical protein
MVSINSLDKPCFPIKMADLKKDLRDIFKVSIVKPPTYSSDSRIFISLDFMNLKGHNLRDVINPDTTSITIVLNAPNNISVNSRLLPNPQYIIFNKINDNIAETPRLIRV